MHLLRSDRPFPCLLSPATKRAGSPVTVGVLVSRTPSSQSPRPRVQLEATLCWEQQSLPLLALIDSGADENFLDITLATQAGITSEQLDVPINANALNGDLLAQITHRTKPLLLVLSNHREYIQFHLISSPLTPIVLGQPWLIKHNPHIDWSLGKIVSWSPFCLSSCLQSALAPVEAANSPPTIEPPDLTAIPTVYHDLGEVFSKQLALSLPPHRPYDCPIDLLPGAPLPSSRLFNLSRPEREVMEKYIHDSLAAGIIRPSSSPVGAGFFFVEKKDHSLRPCIDFRGLNAITVKNKYPLPLINSAFEPIHQATMFSKLDLRNAYHLIRI